MPDFRKQVYDLSPYVPGEQPSVRSRIIKINTNENPYPPSPLAMEAGRKVLEEGILRKYPQPTSQDLRKAIAKVYSLSEVNIIVTNGSDEAIRLLFTAILDSGDSIAYPDPTYSAYPVFADTTLESIKQEKFPLKGNLQFDWEAMKKSQSKLMAFANPNAPTSLLESKESIRDFLNTYRGFTLCDEAYIDYASMGSSMIGEVEKFPNLFVSRTLSKSYALAGLRLGFLIGNVKWIELLNKIRDSYNVGLLDQEIAKSAILDQEYFLKNRENLIHTRERVQNSLLKWGFDVPTSSTNFLFAKPPATYSAEDLFLRLKEKNVYIRYFSQGIASKYLRISIGTEEEMDIFLKELESILRVK
ncbi:MAG: histidinol-phosphate transaminase [Leptospira sp.]|nr:histidinol-phosphate transaminase [Leptospira sp.]